MTACSCRLSSRKGKCYMKKHMVGLAGAFAALGLFSVSSVPALSASRNIMIPMKALNGSKQSGAAALTQLPNGVRVVVSLRNAPHGPEPTHIHSGSCASPKESPAFALKDTVNGKSVTFLPGIRLEALAGTDAIIVHQSLRDLETYVSCGNIR
jgi:FtsP/CotA-like multicopper oxidase with cupredoxin domain